MSLQSKIDALVDTYDQADHDADAADGATAGQVLFREMRNALERFSERMCRDCEGNGYVRNPHAHYYETSGAPGYHTGQYETQDPEEIDCPTCDGSGFNRKTVEPARMYQPTLPDDTEFPF